MENVYVDLPVPQIHLVRSSLVQFFHRSKFLKQLFTELFWLEGQGALSKESTAWLDGALPAKTCIPPSFPGNMNHAAAWHIHSQKYVCKYKKLANFGKINFYVKKSRKVLDKLTCGNSEFDKCEIWAFSPVQQSVDLPFVSVI
jgi:hypothetical protein